MAITSDECWTSERKRSSLRARADRDDCIKADRPRARLEADVSATIATAETTVIAIWT